MTAHIEKIFSHRHDKNYVSQWTPLVHVPFLIAVAIPFPRWLPHPSWVNYNRGDIYTYYAFIDCYPNTSPTYIHCNNDINIHTRADGLSETTGRLHTR